MNAFQTPNYADIQRAGHDGVDFLFAPVKVEVTVSAPEGTTETDDAALNHYLKGLRQAEVWTRCAARSALHSKADVAGMDSESRRSISGSRDKTDAGCVTV